MNERVGEITKNVKEKAKRITAIASIGGAALLAAGCGSGIGSKETAQNEAVARYNKIFENSSPAGKFMLQYLRTTEIDIKKSDDMLLFIHVGPTSTWRQFFFNNGCLQNTAYDIAGGALNLSAESSGLFSSSSAHAEGNIPTAAAFALIDSKNPDDLIIESGHSDSVSLRFSGLEGDQPLIPANAQTENVLETYGCNTGIPSGHKEVHGYDLNNTSPWVDGAQ
jgi:hypothetical protein